MSQSWTDDVFATDHQGTTDLQNMENNFAALKSNFSGASAPSNVVAGQFWYHTSKGMRMRNSANSGWLKSLHGDSDLRTWFYRNDTTEGWVIDSSITDRVLAIKGGSLAYNVNGGNTAGSWTISGMSAANESSHIHATGNHSHKWYDLVTGAADKDGAGTPLSATGGKDYPHVVTSSDNSDAGPDQDLYTDSQGGNTGGGSVHTHTLSQDAGWRPAAAVGTLQYPDLT